MAKTQSKNYHLGAILEDITDRAVKIELLTVAAVDRLSDVANADALCSAVIDMAQRIGWLADLAASQTPGLSPYVGNAEKWMLPERFTRAAAANGINTVEA